MFLRTFMMLFELVYRKYFFQYCCYLILLKAYVKRFPTCDMIPVFLGSDTVFEEESEDKATHSIERRCKLAVNAPYLLRKVSNAYYNITCDLNL